MLACLQRNLVLYVQCTLFVIHDSITCNLNFQRALLITVKPLFSNHSSFVNNTDSKKVHWIFNIHSRIEKVWRRMHFENEKFSAIKMPVLQMTNNFSGPGGFPQFLMPLCSGVQEWQIQHNELVSDAGNAIMSRRKGEYRGY